jgi:hypothetical protein
MCDIQVVKNCDGDPILTYKKTFEGICFVGTDDDHVDDSLDCIIGSKPWGYVGILKVKLHNSTQVKHISHILNQIRDKKHVKKPHIRKLFYEEDVYLHDLCLFEPSVGKNGAIQCYQKLKGSKNEEEENETHYIYIRATPDDLFTVYRREMRKHMTRETSGLWTVREIAEHPLTQRYKKLVRLNICRISAIVLCALGVAGDYIKDDLIETIPCSDSSYQHYGYLRCNVKDNIYPVNFLHEGHKFNDSIGINDAFDRDDEIDLNGLRHCKLPVIVTCNGNSRVLMIKPKLFKKNKHMIKVDHIPLEISLPEEGFNAAPMEISKRFFCDHLFKENCESSYKASHIKLIKVSRRSEC